MLPGASNEPDPYASSRQFPRLVPVLGYNL